MALDRELPEAFPKPPGLCHCEEIEQLQAESAERRSRSPVLVGDSL